MSEHEQLALLAGAVVLVGLIAYVLLGGADFGGGVWDLFATGRRRHDQREAIARAMGPVWEANHVWLIFIIVVLFTCFPRGFVNMGIALFVPLHLLLLGIMLRGASFVFRGFQTSDQRGHRPGRTWRIIFGASSVISPFLLGAAFGALTAGGLDPENPTAGLPAWLGPYSIATGLLALSTCAYLAAVYLTVETEGELREDFRLRAIVAGTATAGLAGVVLVLAATEATWFFQQMMAPRSWPVLGAGLIFFALSAWSVFFRHYRLSRIFAAGQVVLLLIGWGLAQYPYVVYPHLLLTDASASLATIRFLLLALPVGAIVLVPSLWYLFRVFKGKAALPG